MTTKPTNLAEAKEQGFEVIMLPLNNHALAESVRHLHRNSGREATEFIHNMEVGPHCFQLRVFAIKPLPGRIASEMKKRKLAKKTPMQVIQEENNGV